MNRTMLKTISNHRRWVLALGFGFGLSCSAYAQSLVKWYPGEVQLHDIDTNTNSPYVGIEYALIGFEADVTGDGKPERFYTTKRLQLAGEDTWYVYTCLGGENWKYLGNVWFNVLVMKPARWKNDPSKWGFYAYSHAGAGQGSLTFTEVTTNGLFERERRTVQWDNDGKDASECDDLFRDTMSGGESTKRITEIPATQFWHDWEKQRAAPSAMPVSSDRLWLALVSGLSLVGVLIWWRCRW